MLLQDTFEIWFGHREASLPPPEHYEFEIHLQPDECGAIIYRPDYACDETPCWEYRFHWPQASMRALRAQLLGSDLLDSTETPQTDVPAGGSTQSLAIESGAARITIGWDQADRIPADVASAITESVPVYVWAEIKKRRERYVGGENC